MTRFPRYGSDRDYTTNAPSYYDDLARKNKLMKYLAQRIWEYDKTLFESLEHIEHLIGDGFNEEIEKLLIQWMEDGSLDHIINEVLMNQKADKTVVDDLISRLAKIDGIGTERLYVYVDGEKGDDLTADGTEAKPFKTIQACLDAIPKTINQDRFIMIKPGEYPEELSTKSVSGSAIYLQSTDPERYYKIRSAVFYDINGLVRVENAEFTGYEKAFNLRYSRCNYGTTHNCRFTDSKIGTDKVAIEYDGTQGSINSNHFNAQYTCLFAQNGSRVRVDSTNTHGDTPSVRAISVYSAHVYFNEQVEWIDKTSTPITAQRGGRYTWDRSFIKLDLINGWRSVEDIGNDTYEARAFKDDANVIHLFGAIKDGQVGDVNACILPAGYRPVFNTHVFPAYADDGTVAKVVIDRTGQIQIQKGSNTPYVSLSGISFYSGR